LSGLVALGSICSEECAQEGRKKDQEALAEALKKIHRAESQKEAREASQSLRERWGTVYPGIAEHWNQSLCSFGVPTSS